MLNVRSYPGPVTSHEGDAVKGDPQIVHGSHTSGVLKLAAPLVGSAVALPLEGTAAGGTSGAGAPVCVQRAWTSHS